MNGEQTRIPTLTLQIVVSIPILWQHIGNKKSDSQYPMENSENQNYLCQIAHTKLFKPSFTGASGNNYKAFWHKQEARKPLYFKEINTGVPVSRFVRESKDGSYSVLSVRNSLAYFEVGRTLGTSSYSNGITTYQGTQVWAHNIYYMPGANASYYVNHFFNYPASYGRVTSLYSESGSGGYPIAVGGGEIVSSSGEIAAVKYLMIDMSGGYNIGYAYEKLSFNATTKTASLTTLPLY